MAMISTYTYLPQDVTMRVWQLPGPIAPIGEPAANPPTEDEEEANDG